MRAAPPAKANPSASAILWKLSSTAFFSSYLWGGHVEASQQAPVYKYAPDRGKLPIGAYAIVLWLLILASILFWVQNFKIFSFVLFGFYCVDMLVGGTFRRRHLSPVFERSRSLYIRAEDYISLEQLHAIESYIYGNWAHYRFCTGAGLILVAIFGEYHPSSILLALTY